MAKVGRPPKNPEVPELESESFAEKIKTINVAPPSTLTRTKHFPSVVQVCGNTLPVDRDTGKVVGESDPRKIRARQIEFNRKRRLGPEEERIG